MRRLSPPFATMAAGLPTTIDLSGPTLLSNRLLNKDFAFTADEREAFGLRGLLPDRVMTIEEQVQLELERLHRKDDPLEQYIGLAALQDRNETLFYRVLAENLEELLPIVYTPTVGRACQEFSHILRRTRGAWITPDDRDRVPEMLRNAPYDDVRLDRGDRQRAHPRPRRPGRRAAWAFRSASWRSTSAPPASTRAVTLPISLDVGTDNPALLEDPLYIGHREPRLRGAEYDALVDAFVRGVQEVWPALVLQWEDFKHYNAPAASLDRYRDVVPSFNDDIQGTAATVLAGILAGLRRLGQPLAAQRIVLVGAGAAGIGIGRLLRAAMREHGMADAEIGQRLVLVDSRGLVHGARADLDDTKRSLALSPDAALVHGLDLTAVSTLADVVEHVRPTILVGTTGVAGSFTEPVVRAMARDCPRPIILPLSNPTANTEARPADLLAWTDGRAIIATGSPFAPVDHEGMRHEIGQANNVYVFPGIGLGAIVSGARSVTDGMILAAARTLAAAVSDERLASGALYPPIAALREVSRAVAIAVAREAVTSGVAPAQPHTLEADVDTAMWWPDYVPYVAPGAA